MQNDIDEIVCSIAVNLEDYEKIKRLETNSDNIREFEGNKMEWDKISLSHGLPGICLLYGKLMETYPNDARWEKAANRYLGYVVEEINQKGISDISLFSGLSGIGLATACVSKDFRDYKNLLMVINGTILEMLPFYLQHINSDKGTHASFYDVISGLTGILSYLSLFKEDTLCYQGLREGIDALIKLTRTIVINGIEVPGWYISGENQFSQLEREAYPDGNFNTSLSHGIAGPLVFLSEMMREGVCNNNQKDAVQRIVDFYFLYGIIEDGRKIWKGQIEFEEIKNKSPNKHNLVKRDAWCYGTPGICYSLIQAGYALGDQKMIEFGIGNLKQTIPDIKGIYSPTFCHGYAGIYQIMNSVETLVSKQIYTEEKKFLKEKILAFYDPEWEYGFHNIEYDNMKGCFRPYSSTGLLEGTVGVCLSLFEAKHVENCIWKKAFLLA